MSEWKDERYGMPVFIYRGVPVYLASGGFIVPSLRLAPFLVREDAFKAIDQHLDKPSGDTREHG